MRKAFRARPLHPVCEHFCLEGRLLVNLVFGRMPVKEEGADKKGF